MTEGGDGYGDGVGARGGAFVASILVPGSGQLRGRRVGVGVGLMLGWLFLLAIPVFAWERVAGAWGGRSTTGSRSSR